MNTFDIVLITILIAFIVIGAVIGLLKGFTRSLFTVFTNLAAGLCALLLARPIVSFFIKLPIIADALNDALISTGLEDVTESFLVLLASIVSAFASPSIFFILYILLYLILKIPFYFIYKACVKGGETPNKPLGALVCALNSILFFIFLLTPLAGYYNTGLSVVNSLESFPESSQISAITELAGEPIEMNEVFALNLVYTSGGKAMFNHLSSIKYGDEKVAFSEEVDTLCKIALNAGLLVEGIEESNSTNTKRYVDELAASLSESILIKGGSVEGLKLVALAWQNGNLDGEWLAEFDAIGLTPVIDELADYYISCDTRMVTEDFTTISSLLGVLSGSELLDILMTAEEDTPANDVIALVTSEDLLHGVLLALYKNPRFNAVLPELSDVGVILICESAGIDSEGAPKNPTNMSDITENDIKNEAVALSTAFTAFSEAFTGSSTDIFSLDQLADAVSALEDSFLFSHSVSYITFALLKENASEALGEIGISNEALDKLSENSNISVSTIISATESISNIISSIDTSDDNALNETVEAISSTLVTLDPETTAALSEVISPDMFEDYIEEYAPDIFTETIKQELESYYSENEASFEDAETAKENLSNLANIFGIDLFENK